MRSLFLALLVGSFFGCYAEQNTFPSYGGIYQRQSLTFANGWPGETGPADADFYLQSGFPEKIGVYQHRFNRRAGINQHRLDIVRMNGNSLGDIAGIIGHFSLDKGRDYDGNPVGRHFKSVYDGNYVWSDPDTYIPFEGYGCQFLYGAHLETWVTPGPDVLEEAYETCGETDIEGLCPTPPEWTDLEVKDIGWYEKEISVRFRLTVFKKMNPASIATCGYPREGDNVNYIVNATYVRTHSVNMGDLRLEEDPIHEEKRRDALDGQPDILFDLFALPEEISDLRELFPE